jgi:ABC-2 type transport system permease protein
MPVGLRWFAEYQPFTPFIESIRGLLSGSATGTGLVPAIAWSVVIALGGYAWALALYERKSVR